MVLENSVSLLYFDERRRVNHFESASWNNLPRWADQTRLPKREFEGETDLAVVCPDEVKRATRGVLGGLTPER